MPRRIHPAALTAAVGLVVAALGLALRTGTGTGAGIGTAPGSAVVTFVVDGDTVVVSLGDDDVHVRLIGIDTPETVDPDTPAECYGAEASQHLSTLLPRGTPVRLVRDVEARDRYDRLLVYLYRSSDELFVNLAQVAEGYAEAMAYPPNTAHRGDFEQAERQARIARTGLWGVCGDADTPASQGGRHHRSALDTVDGRPP